MKSLLLALLLTQQNTPAPSAGAVKPAPAAPAALTPVENLRDWFTKGKLAVDYRLRYEHVDEDSFSAQATGVTLRTRNGFRTASFNNWSAYVDVESVFALREDYNSTANGRTSRPVIVDPDGSEFNQAYIAHGFNTPTQVIVGRQRLAWDNQRFVSNAGFRQNEQTFDALYFGHSKAGYSLKLAYVDKVHRIFGNNNPNALLRQQDIDAVFASGGYQFQPNSGALSGSTLNAYGYFVKNQDLPLASNRTLGLRYAGGQPFGEGKRFTYAFEYATQDDYRGGSANIDADYSVLEAGLSFEGGRYTVRAVQETLGGDGRYGFQTPFGLLHAYNGWSDRFLVTPNTGLRDRYIDAGAKFGPGILSAQFHIFDADSRDQRYGKEHGVQYVNAFSDRLTGTFKAARYQSQSFSTDTDKFWLFLDYRY